MADWRSLLLARLSAPQSAENLLALQLWADSEGIAAYANNPLAAEDLAMGSKPYPPAPAVQEYTSLDEAVIVYAHKLASATYEPIAVALTSNRGLQTIYDAINASPWARGQQHGHYPVALYTYLTVGEIALQLPGGAHAPAVPTIAPTLPPDVIASFQDLGRAVGKRLPDGLNAARASAARIVATAAGRR